MNSDRRPAPEVEPIPEGVVTVLMTDVEGSTRLWDDEPRSMAPAIDEHERLTVSIVAAHGGRTLQTRGEGDSTLSVFERASDAAAAAIALQDAWTQTRWPGGIELPTRISVHTGEAYQRDGAYHGGALNRAARIRGLAAGGQVLVSATTAGLVADTLADDLVLEDRGEHRLKGLRRSESVFELRRVPDRRSDVAQTTETATERPPKAAAAEAPSGAASFPPPLASAETSLLVGRDSELRAVESVVDSLLDGGRPGALFVAGEAGIGKTTLVANAARGAHDRGGAVLYGWCDEGLSAPYQPFVQALRGWLATTTEEQLTSCVGPLSGALLPLLPELARAATLIAELPESDPETERLRLFDAFVEILGAIASGAPAVLVLDDLHWASESSAMLLRHLVRARRAAVLVLATFRPTDVERDHPFARAITDLRRLPDVGRVDLGGLTHDALRALATGYGLDASDETLQRIELESAGNAFFASELMRNLPQLDSDASAADLPDTVVDVVVERVDRLPDVARSALRAAAVVGLDFDVTTVASAAELDAAHVLDAFGQAERAQLVRPVGQRWSFVHALVRSALLHDLDTATLARLHLGAAEALGSSAQPVAAEVARHYAAAAPVAGGERVAEWFERAARVALDQVAYEEAVALAAEGLGSFPAGDDHEALRLRLTLLHGEALRAAGRFADAQPVYEAAMTIAHRLDDSIAQADAALGLLGPPENTPIGSIEVVPLDKALDALGDRDPSRAARLLAARAMAHLDASEIADGEDCFARALELAQRSGDVESIGFVRRARHRTWWAADEVEQRVAAARELRELGIEHAAREVEAWGRRWTIIHGAEMGDFELLADEMARLEALAVELHHPFHQWFVDSRGAVLAAATGDLQRADHLLEAAASGADRIGSAYVTGVTPAVRTFVDLLYGRLDTISDDSPPVGGAELGWQAVIRDDRETAAATVERWTSPDLLGLFTSATAVNPGPNLYSIAVLAAAVGDPTTCRRVAEVLWPFTGRLVVPTPFVGFWGSYDYSLGRLAEATGELGEAEARFRSALALESAIGARPCAARSKHALARVLRDQDAGDSERAAELEREAHAEAAHLGMQRLGLGPDDVVEARRPTR